MIDEATLVEWDRFDVGDGVKYALHEAISEIRRLQSDVFHMTVETSVAGRLRIENEAISIMYRECEASRMRLDNALRRIRSLDEKNADVALKIAREVLG